MCCITEHNGIRPYSWLKVKVHTLGVKSNGFKVHIIYSVFCKPMLGLTSHAKRKGVSPSWPLTSTDAPFSTKKRIRVELPLRAASCSAVQPLVGLMAARQVGSERTKDSMSEIFFLGSYRTSKIMVWSAPTDSPAPARPRAPCAGEEEGTAWICAGEVLLVSSINGCTVAVVD